MPIAPLLAPTLTVDVQTHQTAQEMPVPSINFSTKFDMRQVQNYFGGAQPEISRIGLQVALGNQLLSLDPPKNVQNGSYFLSFYGPGLQCPFGQ